MLSRASLKEGDMVLEVGPGPGILTQALLNSPIRKLVSIEIDHQFWPSLEQMESQKFSLIKEDALQISLSDFTSPLKIIANLPYNVGTLLIIKWIEQIEKVSDMVLMLQKEVVDRICAIPRTKDYGRLTILVQSVCGVKKCFLVSPGNFSPQPKVDSAVVQITPKQHKPFNLLALAHLTKVFFESRRKIIRHALKRLDIEVESEILKEIGVQHTMRPEEITVEQYIEMAIHFENKL